jgi:hypothetical protein
VAAIWGPCIAKKLLHKLGVNKEQPGNDGRFVCGFSVVSGGV